MSVKILARSEGDHVFEVVLFTQYSVRGNSTLVACILCTSTMECAVHTLVIDTLDFNLYAITHIFPVVE